MCCEIIEEPCNWSIAQSWTNISKTKQRNINLDKIPCRPPPTPSQCFPWNDNLDKAALYAKRNAQRFSIKGSNNKKRKKYYSVHRRAKHPDGLATTPHRYAPFSSAPQNLLWDRSYHKHGPRTKDHNINWQRKKTKRIPQHSFCEAKEEKS